MSRLGDLNKEGGGTVRADIEISPWLPSSYLPPRSHSKLQNWNLNSVLPHCKVSISSIMPYCLSEHAVKQFSLNDTSRHCRAKDLVWRKVAPKSSKLFLISSPSLCLMLPMPMLSNSEEDFFFLLISHNQT